MFEFFHINETLSISLLNGCLFLGTVGPMKALASFFVALVCSAAARE